MDKKKKEDNDSTLSKKEQEVSEYPGEAIDIADDDKVDKKLVKERTKTLNNNPRNEGKII